MIICWQRDKDVIVHLISLLDTKKSESWFIRIVLGLMISERGRTMKAAVVFLIHFAFILSTALARSIVPQPQALRSFKINDTQNAGSCSYTVSITTSCSSPRYTRDRISIAFGDAYGYQVYAPRIDSPHSRAFESCSTDTFQISGPCTYQICNVYLYRSGYDGWIVDTVTIYGYYSKAVTFYYNAVIPNNMWFGFNLCHGASASFTSNM